MKHVPQRTAPVTAKKLKVMAAQMEECQAAIEEAARYLDGIKDSPSPELWVFALKTGELGLKNIRRYASEVREALYAAMSGEPQTAETLKARSRPAEPPPKKRKG